MIYLKCQTLYSMNAQVLSRDSMQWTSRRDTVRAEDCGCEGAMGAQQLPSNLPAHAAQLFRHECHSVPCLIQYGVLVGLLKAEDHCAPAGVTSTQLES